MNRHTGRAIAIGGLITGLLVGMMTESTLAQDTPSELTTLSGTFTKEAEQYAIDGTEMSFGPAWYIVAVDAEADYDQDGTVEAIAAELDGLVGTTVTVEGELGRCGDVDAFTINGETYRSAGRPPWAGGPKVVGSIHPGLDDADEDHDGAGRPPWAGTGQGKPCS